MVSSASLPELDGRVDADDGVGSVGFVGVGA